MNRWRRTAIAVLVVTMTVGASLVVTASAAQANENTLWVGKIGEPRGTFGANAAVRVWGGLRFKNSGCPEDGVPDFVYPASDVYLVTPGAAGEGSALVDATGGAPNTVVEYANPFADEVIGITAPAGTLSSGEYDVVFDTCQDGVFQSADDTVFSRAVTVRIPADLPTADAALTKLKGAAYDEYKSWRTTQRIMNGVWKLAEKALKNGCRAGNPTACALKYGNYFSPIQEQFDGLLLNQGQHYLGIYEDPPNPDFDQAVVLEKVNLPTDAIAGEGVLVQALLRSVEAYKGAQQAGDAEWALVHAREVRDLHAALAQQMLATSAQLTDLAARYGDQADEALQLGGGLARRAWATGLTATEKRALREVGLTAAQVTQLETEMGSAFSSLRASTVREVLGTQVAVHTNAAVAVRAGFDAWSAIVDAMTGNAAVPDRHPQVGAGGPYRVEEGSPVTLAGTVLPPDTEHADWSFGWDLDGDRDFDDATGTNPTVVFADPGSPVVGIRATDAAGRTGYGWASVTVTARGQEPVIGAVDPNANLVTVQTGATKQFTATAEDREDGALEIHWSVDGAGAGTGGSLPWTAPPLPGVHQVTASATDADGHRVFRSWDVAVHRPDADGDGWTATTDCADGDPAVHPGQIEFLGNGLDDDCDSGSPDAPPGGLTGKPYGWGRNATGAVGNGVSGPDHPAPVQTVLADDVVQVEIGPVTGFAVRADRTVLSWGGNNQGVLGSGTSGGNRPTPEPVVGPEGVGVLAGVQRIAVGDHTAAAVRTDGTVMTWGNNVNGQLGDGTTANSRNRPGSVLTGANTPLTGVRDVEVASQSAYALMKDGTVMAWGSVSCLGASAVQQAYAVRVPGLTDIRQIAGSDSLMLFLRKDGTVLSCGVTEPELGRDYKLGAPTSPYLPNPVTDLGPGSTVIDIAGSTSSAAALKEDGALFMWGRNLNHELDPILKTGHATRVPLRVPLPEGPPAVGLDHDGSQNTVLTLADGSMLGWGGNMNGGAGTGDTGPVDKPKRIDVPGRVALHAVTSTANGLALTRAKDDPELELPAWWVQAEVVDVALGEAGGGAFTVRLDHALTDDVALTWVLEAGSATAADATLTTGTVVVPAGQTSASIPVVVADDALDEDEETVTLTLTGARLGLKIGKARAVGTIADNDDPPVMSIKPVSVVEGGTSLTDTPVTFELSGPSGKEVSASYATADGSARAGTDYVSSSATIRFAPGETVDVVHLAVKGDADVEPEETFIVAVDEVVNGTAAGPGTVKITDDEVITVSVSAPTLVEGAAGDFVVTVQPPPPAGVTVSVPWRLVETDADGDLAPGSGTLTLSADHPSGKVTATAVDDQIAAEDPEPFRLELLELTASDGHRVVRGEIDPAWITDNDKANEPPVVTAGNGATTVEGTAFTLTGTVTDDTTGFTAVWTVAGPCEVAADGVQASVTCTDNGVFAATLTATDRDGVAVSGVTTVRVENAAPVLGTVVVDAVGARIEFTDPGIGDTHTCKVKWGDNTPDGELTGALSPCVLSHAYAAGTYTATVTVVDGDGGLVSKPYTVKVAPTAWPFHGFLHPVRNPPAVNKVKAGKPIKVKFGLGGYRGMNIFAPGSPTSRPITCGCGRNDVVQQDAAAGGSSLSYDAKSNTYTYVWTTDRAWAGQCRRLVVTLADGTQHWADFSLS